jgi:hypothetical protein
MALFLGVGSGAELTVAAPQAHTDSALNNLRPNISISAGGHDIVKSGTATAASSGRHSVAIAVGKNNTATASTQPTTPLSFWATAAPQLQRTASGTAPW